MSGRGWGGRENAAEQWPGSGRGTAHQEAHTQQSLCLHPIANTPRLCPGSAGPQLSSCCTSRSSTLSRLIYRLLAKGLVDGGTADAMLVDGQRQPVE